MCILTTMTNKAVFRAFLGTVYCTSFRIVESLSGNGCRPPLPLSSAPHLGQSVGAGHARPAALPLPPMYLLPRRRGLDPSAAYRRREPQKPLRPASRPPPTVWGGLLRTASPSAKGSPYRGAGRAREAGGIPAASRRPPYTWRDSCTSLSMTVHTPSKFFITSLLANRSTRKSYFCRNSVRVWSSAIPFSS